ncbi:MAG: trehalose-6-phosphate synthase [Labilithrix sp.]
MARTSEFPAGLGCAASLRADGSREATNEFRVGDEHGKPLGVIVMVHDLSYADRREAAARWLALLAFGAFGAFVLVVMVGAWRSNEVVVRTPAGERAPDFAPLMRDVRELAEQLSDETQARPAFGWTRERLRETLATTFAGERVIIVANREPYIHEKHGDAIEVVHPASGLVTALEPVMRACSGVWVAHGSGSADRETSDARGRVWVPPGEKLYTTRRVWLTPEEEKGYYYGFSNEGLWPLCHVAHTRPKFRAGDFEAYRAVNAKFAAAVADEMDRDDATVLVQDYHLALAPAHLRELAPQATILSFWHIPWPNVERFGICPQHAELLRGLLGSSIVGFHTQQHCNNFLDAVDRYLEARIDRELDAVLFDGRWTLVRAYPISIEWPNRWLDAVPAVDECRRLVQEEHGLRPEVRIGVGVDRIDYTKGIEERLLAVERLLERRPDVVGRFSFIQLGAPSRTKIAAYQDLNDQIEALVARIHRRFATSDWKPIILHRAHHEPETVFRYYRAADVCYVSSLHDGMNLVAKEFVAARDDEHGVLVLSRFTGAARELTEALLVNPYDLEEASDALAAALGMSAGEQVERMRALRSYVAEWNVYRWAGRMLLDAARLRQGQRLAGRIGGGRGEQGSLARLVRPRSVRVIR